MRASLVAPAKTWHLAVPVVLTRRCAIAHRTDRKDLSLQKLRSDPVVPFECCKNNCFYKFDTGAVGRFCVKYCPGPNVCTKFVSVFEGSVIIIASHRLPCCVKFV